MKYNTVDWVASLLTIIGALNWGLIGALKVNLVETLFGDMTALSRTVYVLVGLSGLYMLYRLMSGGSRDSAHHDRVV